jgi:hypothetical protein
LETQVARVRSELATFNPVHPNRRLMGENGSVTKTICIVLLVLQGPALFPPLSGGEGIVRYFAAVSAAIAIPALTASLLLSIVNERFGLSELRPANLASWIGALTGLTTVALMFVSLGLAGLVFVASAIVFGAPLVRLVYRIKIHVKHL